MQFDQLDRSVPTDESENGINFELNEDRHQHTRRFNQILRLTKVICVAIALKIYDDVSGPQIQYY